MDSGPLYTPIYARSYIMSDGLWTAGHGILLYMHGHISCLTVCGQRATVYSYIHGHTLRLTEQTDRLGWLPKWLPRPYFNDFFVMNAGDLIPASITPKVALLSRRGCHSKEIV